eukprot:2014352-Karenia_brevis.AAC.1
MSVHRLAAVVGDSSCEKIPVFICDAITWKDTTWWRQQQHNADLHGSNAGSWRHASHWRGQNKRWDTPLVYHYGRNWLQMAGQDFWHQSRQRFIERAFDMIGCRLSRQHRNTGPTEPARKKARIVIDTPVPWNLTVDCVPLELVGDSAL